MAEVRKGDRVRWKSRHPVRSERSGDPAVHKPEALERA
jgi:hypothetical protein